MCRYNVEIFKKLSPACFDCQGGSHGSTNVLEFPFKTKSSKRRGLNLSVTSAIAEDLPGQVKRLVEKV